MGAPALVSVRPRQLARRMTPTLPMRRADMTRAWKAFMRQASLQYFFAGFVVVNSRPQGSNVQRRVISSRWLDFRPAR
jgi:hypothetical protein